MLPAFKCSSSLTIFSIQSGALPLNSDASLKRCFGTEWTIFSCLIQLELTRPFVWVVDEPWVYTDQALVSILRLPWPFCKHGTLAPNSVSMLLLSRYLACHSVGEFSSRSYRPWNLLSPPWAPCTAYDSGHIKRGTDVCHKCFGNAISKDDSRQWG